MNKPTTWGTPDVPPKKSPTVIHTYTTTSAPGFHGGDTRGFTSDTTFWPDIEDARLNARECMGVVLAVELEVKCVEHVPGEDYRGLAYQPALDKAGEVFKRLAVREPNATGANAAIAVMIGVDVCPAGALSYQEMLEKFLLHIHRTPDIDTAARDYLHALLNK